MTGAPKSYHQTLTLYYEEEIMGEAYFQALAANFSDPAASAKCALLARVERAAARSVEPLLAKLGLVPRGEPELHALGLKSVERHAHFTWPELVSYMVKRYPLYMDEFHGLEAMAPADDLPFLHRLTAHETAAIAFANKEAAGEADSTAPLEDYLQGTVS